MQPPQTRLFAGHTYTLLLRVRVSVEKELLGLAQFVIKVLRGEMPDAR